MLHVATMMTLGPSNRRFPSLVARLSIERDKMEFLFAGRFQNILFVIGQTETNDLRVVLWRYFLLPQFFASFQVQTYHRRLRPDLFVGQFS